MGHVLQRASISIAHEGHSLVRMLKDHRITPEFNQMDRYDEVALSL